MLGEIGAAPRELEGLISKLESYDKKFSQACRHAVYLQRRMFAAAGDSLARYEELRAEFGQAMQDKSKFHEKIARLENQIGAKFSEWRECAEQNPQRPEERRTDQSNKRALDAGDERYSGEDDDDLPELVPITDPAEAVAVAALLRKQLNAAIQTIRMDEIVVERAANRNRKFHKHLLQVGSGSGNTISVLAKADTIFPPDHWVWRVESFMGALQLAEFRSPRFFGTCDAGDGRTIAVWEYTWLQRKTKTVAENLELVTRAAASIASLTQEVVTHTPEIERRIDFLKPMAGRIRERWLESGGGDAASGSLADGIDRLAAIEDRALKRLAAMKPVLCHNDFAAHNIFIPSKGPPVIIDWESVSLGPPGACLRAMARRDNKIQARVAELFATCLSDKGTSISAEEVLYSLRAVELFRALRSAQRNTARNSETRQQNLHWALDHLDYLEFA
jgi:thiamine kinase-like enzyme